MKKHLPLALSGFVLIVGLLFGTSPPVYADANDDAVMQEASAAIDNFSNFAATMPENPNQGYYKSFSDKADRTRRIVSHAHAEMAGTTELGATADAVMSVRLELSDIKRELAALRDAASAEDAETLNSTLNQFEETVGYYNDAVDAYRDTAAHATPAVVEIITVLSIVLVIPLWLVIRTISYKKRIKRGNVSTNEALAVSSKKFLILNLATFGFYSCYWAWKAWQIVAHAEHKKYFSTVRGFFIPFTALDLFPRIKKFAEQEGYGKKIKDQDLAALYFVVYLIFTAATFFIENILFVLLVVLVEAVCIWLLTRPVLSALNHYLTHTSDKLQPIGNDWKMLFIFSACGVLIVVSILGYIFGWV